MNGRRSSSTPGSVDLQRKSSASTKTTSQGVESASTCSRPFHYHNQTVVISEDTVLPGGLTPRGSRRSSLTAPANSTTITISTFQKPQLDAVEVKEELPKQMKKTSATYAPNEVASERYTSSIYTDAPEIGDGNPLLKKQPDRMPFFRSGRKGMQELSSGLLKKEISALSDREGHGILAKMTLIDFSIPESTIPDKYHVFEEIRDDVTGKFTGARRRVFPTKEPSNRSEAFLLEKSFDKMITDASGDFEKIVRSCHSGINEVIRQISVHCIERGRSLSRIWKQYTSTVESEVGNIRKQSDRHAAAASQAREENFKLRLAMETNQAEFHRSEVGYKHRIERLEADCRGLEERLISYQQRIEMLSKLEKKNLEYGKSLKRIQSILWRISGDWSSQRLSSSLSLSQKQFDELQNAVTLEQGLNFADGLDDRKYYEESTCISKQERKINESATPLFQRVERNALKGASGELSEPTLYRFIMEIYKEKVHADEHDLKEGQKGQSFSDFVYDYLLTKYGIKSVADQKMQQLLFSCQQFEEANQRVNVFSKMMKDTAEAEQLSLFLTEVLRIVLNYDDSVGARECSDGRLLIQCDKAVKIIEQVVGELRFVDMQLLTEQISNSSFQISSADYHIRSSGRDHCGCEQSSMREGHECTCKRIVRVVDFDDFIDIFVSLRQQLQSINTSYIGGVFAASGLCRGSIALDDFSNALLVCDGSLSSRKIARLYSEAMRMNEEECLSFDAVMRSLSIRSLFLKKSKGLVEDEQELSRLTRAWKQFKAEIVCELENGAHATGLKDERRGLQGAVQRIEQALEGKSTRNLRDCFEQVILSFAKCKKELLSQFSTFTESTPFSGNTTSE